MAKITLDFDNLEHVKTAKQKFNVIGEIHTQPSSTRNCGSVTFRGERENLKELIKWYVGSEDSDDIDFFNSLIRE